MKNVESPTKSVFRFWRRTNDPLGQFTRDKCRKLRADRYGSCNSFDFIPKYSTKKYILIFIHSAGLVLNIALIAWLWLCSFGGWILGCALGAVLVWAWSRKTTVDNVDPRYYLSPLTPIALCLTEIWWRKYKQHLTSDSSASAAVENLLVLERFDPVQVNQQYFLVHKMYVREVLGTLTTEVDKQIQDTDCRLHQLDRMSQAMKANELFQSVYTTLTAQLSQLQEKKIAIFSVKQEYTATLTTLHQQWGEIEEFSKLALSLNLIEVNQEFINSVDDKLKKILQEGKVLVQSTVEFQHSIQALEPTGEEVSNLLRSVTERTC